MDLIKHKKIRINNQLITSHNSLLKTGDIIAIDTNVSILPNITKTLHYIEINQKLNLCVFLREPELTEIFYPFKIQPNLIFEYFNKS